MERTEQAVSAPNRAEPGRVRCGTFDAGIVRESPRTSARAKLPAAWSKPAEVQAASPTAHARLRHLNRGSTPARAPRFLPRSSGPTACPRWTCATAAVTLQVTALKRKTSKARGEPRVRTGARRSRARARRCSWSGRWRRLASFRATHAGRTPRRRESCAFRRHSALRRAAFRDRAGYLARWFGAECVRDIGQAHLTSTPSSWSVGEAFSMAIVGL